MISLENIFEVCAEFDFRKSSSLYINSSDRVLLLVKLHAFTVIDSERDNDRVCF